MKLMERLRLLVLLWPLNRAAAGPDAPEVTAAVAAVQTARGLWIRRG